MNNYAQTSNGATQQSGEYDMAMSYNLWQQQYNQQFYHPMNAYEAPIVGYYPHGQYGQVAAAPLSTGPPAFIHSPSNDNQVIANQIVTSNQTPTAPPDVTLESHKDWKKLHEQTNEMMVTNAGRELFPIPQYKIRNLDESKMYVLGLKLRLQENAYLERRGDKWRAARKTFIGVEDSNEIFLESHSGSDLMRQSVLFEYAKLYNVGNERKKEAATKKPKVEKEIPTKGRRFIRTTRKMKVQTNCRYIPELTIYEDCGNGVLNKIHSYVFEETEFIVVTKYNNQTIRQLKSSWNKFVRFDIKEKAKDSEKENQLPPAHQQIASNSLKN
uniref:T-box domain-containing protein n=1 Tax=Caenorhabditis tropicalis TaxID=1561998 RepID=A0A1I7SZ96_9PELO